MIEARLSLVLSILCAMMAFTGCMTSDADHAIHDKAEDMYSVESSMIQSNVDSIVLCHVPMITQNVFRVSLEYFELVFGDEARCTTIVETEEFSNLFSKALEQGDKSKYMPFIRCRIISYSPNGTDTIGVGPGSFEYRGKGYEDSSLASYVKDLTKQ